jgi:hypothetical protein
MIVDKGSLRTAEHRRRIQIRCSFNIRCVQIRLLPFIQFDPSAEKESHKPAFIVLSHRRTIALDGIIEVLDFS